MAEDSKQWVRFVQIGIQFAVSVLACFAAGYWLDSKLNTSPWFMLAGSAVGIGVGMYSMLRDTGGIK